jgi:hypothetical protein
MADIQQKLKIEDDPSVLEIYGNKLVSTSFDGGAVVITMGTARIFPERIDEMPQQGQQPVIHVTSRLALSPSAAVELRNALDNILGAIRRAASPPAAGASSQKMS